MRLDDLIGLMSNSRTETWERCQAVFFYRYVQGMTKPPSASLARGRAYDRTSNEVYQEKFSQGEPLSLDYTRDLFASIWDEEKDGVDNWQGDTPEGVLDTGMKVLDPWLNRVVPYVDPTRPPQVKFEIDCASPNPDRDDAADIDPLFVIRGAADLVAHVPWGVGRFVAVVDHKASGKPWGPADALREMQPGFYRVGLPGLNAELFQFHVFRTALKEPKTTILGRTVGPQDTKLALARVSMARRQIANAFRVGDFIPNRKNVLCSRRWCAFWAECEREHGGRVPE